MLNGRLFSYLLELSPGFLGLIMMAGNFFFCLSIAIIGTVLINILLRGIL